jgi:hypothetical protein
MAKAGGRASEAVHQTVHARALLCRPGLLLLALEGPLGAALLLLGAFCGVCCAVCSCTGVLRVLGALAGTALQHTRDTTAL